MIGLETWQRDATLLTRAGDAELEPPSEQAFLQLVSAELLGPNQAAPVSATWVYARWKPRVSLTSGWELRFADGEVEVVGMKQYCGSKASELAGRRLLHTDACGRLLPHAVLPERGLHLWSFPHDRVLPGLERMLDMRRTRRLIDDSGLFAPLVMRPGPSTLTPLRYKPERRGVFRLDLRLRPEGGGPRTKARVAIRVLPIEEARRVAENRRACAAAGGELLFPNLLYHEERTGLLIEEWLDIEAPDRRDFAHAEPAGRLLAQLHALPVEHATSARASASTELFDWHNELASKAARKFETSSAACTWTHGDLHPEQLAQVDDAWRFLDLDCLAPGNPLSDLATWIADEMTEVDGRDFASASADLLAGYGAVDRSALASCVAQELRSRAAGALRRLQVGAVESALEWLERAADVAPSQLISGFDAGLAFAARELAPQTLVGAVERVEVDKKQRVMVTANTPTGLRWFQQSRESSTEIFPADDERLPLAQSKRFQADRVISWRSGRRIVLREEFGYLKGCRKNRFDEVVLRHRRALEGQDSQSFRVPVLLEENAELACVLFEPIVGVPILDAPDVTAAFGEVGRRLRNFQGGTQDGLPTHGFLEELGVLDALHKRIEAACGEPSAGWLELRARLNESVPSLPRAVLAHRDLHDGQFIWSEDGVALLDFDLLCSADSSLDVANLCAHLELRSLQNPEGFDARAKGAARSAFLAGYAPSEGPEFERRLAFHEATTFLRLALLYSLRPRWQSLVPALIKAGERSRSCLAT